MRQAKVLVLADVLNKCIVYALGHWFSVCHVQILAAKLRAWSPDATHCINQAKRTLRECPGCASESKKFWSS
jgi:hypothetical protein